MSLCARTGHLRFGSCHFFYRIGKKHFESIPLQIGRLGSVDRRGRHEEPYIRVKLWYSYEVVINARCSQCVEHNRLRPAKNFPVLHMNAQPASRHPTRSEYRRSADGPASNLM